MAAWLGYLINTLKRSIEVIVKFVEIKDESGYYDPNATNPGASQPGRVIHGWALSEVYVDSDNVSHFHMDQKLEANKDSIVDSLDLNPETSFTKVYLKSGPTNHMSVVASTEQVCDRIQGVHNARRR
jgi:hypothetical protein